MHKMSLNFHQNAKLSAREQLLNFRQKLNYNISMIREVFSSGIERGYVQKGSQHCGTLRKCFAPKILGKAACWHVAPYGHIMTYYGEKNSKKANLWATRPPEASKLKYRIRDLFEPFPWLKALIKVLKRLCCSIYIIYFVSGCFWGPFWVIQGSF